MHALQALAVLLCMFCILVSKNESTSLFILPRQNQSGSSPYVILAWNEKGRSAIFGREIGVPDREVFSWRKKLILVAKIVISSTVDHCKMFYLPVYVMLNNTVHCQGSR